MVGMLWFSLDRAPMRLSLLRQGDWPGIATMAIGLGALQTVLEEGNKDDWFGSPYILRLSIVAAISLSLFLWIELTSGRPLLNLRSSCRSISRACRATTPSRSAWCWRGPACRPSICSVPR